jgi:probable HAF family extracellular repeat protein
MRSKVSRATTITGLLNAEVAVGATALTPPVLAAPTSTPPAANATYTTIDFPGAAGTMATGINRYGTLGHSADIVGIYADTTGSHGFLLSRGHYTALDVAGGVNTKAWGINDLGQVVGTFEDNAAHLHNFVFQAGAYTLVNDHRCHTGVIYGMNDAGQPAGTEEETPDAQGRYSGYTQTPGHCLKIDYPGASFTSAYGINNHGMLVGSISGLDGIRGAIFSTSLGVPGGIQYSAFDVPGADQTLANGINDSGVIVGYYMTPDGRVSGFAYDNGIFTTFIPPGAFNPPGALGASVQGINNADTFIDGRYSVVGVYSDHDRRHGFVADVTSTVDHPAGGH